MAVKNDAKSVRDIEQDEVEAVIVDINDTSIADGESQEIDAKEDWQAQAAPPPGDGARYRVKIFSGNKQENHEFEQGRKQGYADDDPKGVYYTKQLSCKIQDEGGAWNNHPIDYKVSTGVPRGKKVSTMVGLMLMGGVQIKSSSMTDKQVAALFAKWLAKEPLLTIAGDWSAWDTSAKTKQTPFGVLLKAGMKNFPLKADGKSRNHIIKNKNGQEFVAKLKIVKWIGKGVAPAALAPVAPTAPAKPPVAAKPAAKPEPIVEEVVEAESESEFSFDNDGEVVLEG